MSTERRNPRSVDIDLFPTERILRIINAEDALIANAVAAAIPEIAKVVDMAVEAIRAGGRVIYAGAGTSGRLGFLDAVECPPTFGSPQDWIQAIIAGGSKALLGAREGSEDDRDQAVKDLKRKKLSSKDIVIGVTASGKTPYTQAAIEYARSKGARTAAVVARTENAQTGMADVVISTPVGPEVIAGSTRMKCGTAQKLVLNMISTAAMIRLGMTYSNWMVNVTMTNGKLRARGIHLLREILGVNEDEAAKLLRASGSNLKIAVVMGATGCSRKEADDELTRNHGNLRKVVAHMNTGRE